MRWKLTFRYWIGLWIVIQIATIIAVYADWGFADMKGVGWKWAGIIWAYSIITYFPLDIIKFVIRYILSGKAWNLMLERKVWNEKTRPSSSSYSSYSTDVNSLVVCLIYSIRFDSCFSRERFSFVIFFFDKRVLAVLRMALKRSREAIIAWELMLPTVFLDRRHSRAKRILERRLGKRSGPRLSAHSTGCNPPAPRWRCLNRTPPTDQISPVRRNDEQRWLGMWPTCSSCPCILLNNPHPSPGSRWVS